MPSSSSRDVSLIITPPPAVTTALLSLKLGHGVTIPAQDHGGAIMNYMGVVVVRRSRFLNCTAKQGGAIYTFMWGFVDVADSSFSGCWAGQCGTVAVCTSNLFVTLTGISLCNVSVLVS
jgi:hypothetical protein